MTMDGDAIEPVDVSATGTPATATPTSGTAAAATDPVETTRLFVEAVAWGDHQTVWELLGADGRETVLNVAVNHGMDEAVAARLREGTAAAGERGTFLVDLVYGLRNDLTGNDLDALTYEMESDEMESESSGPSPSTNTARVVLSAQMPAALGGGLPVASAELSHDGEGWRVERLVPRRSQSA